MPSKKTQPKDAKVDFDKIHRILNNRRLYNKTLPGIIGNYINDNILIRYVPVDEQEEFFVIDLLSDNDSLLSRCDVSIISDDSEYKTAVLKSYKAGDFAVYYHGNLLTHGKEEKVVLNLFILHGDKISDSLKVHLKNFFFSEDTVEGPEIKTKFYLRPDVDIHLSKIKGLIEKAGLLYQTIGTVKPKDPIKEHLKFFLKRKCADLLERKIQKSKIISLLLKDYDREMDRLFSKGAVKRNQFIKAGLNAQDIFSKLIKSGWLKEIYGVGFLQKDLNRLDEGIGLKKIFGKDTDKVLIVLQSDDVADEYKIEPQTIRRTVKDVLKDSKLTHLDPHGFPRYSIPAHVFNP